MRYSIPRATCHAQARRCLVVMGPSSSSSTSSPSSASKAPRRVAYLVVKSPLSCSNDQSANRRESGNITFKNVVVGSKTGHLSGHSAKVVGVGRPARVGGVGRTQASMLPCHRPQPRVHNIKEGMKHSVQLRIVAELLCFYKFLLIIPCFQLRYNLYPQ